MEREEAEELRKELTTNIQDEIGTLMYKEPKCDFEHIWNSAIDKAQDCCNGYGAE